MENRWDLNFGPTPSTNTGPRYDHTLYSQKGIFLLSITKKIASTKQLY